MTVAAICYEGELAAACLAEYKPDLVFLTIEMPRLSVLPLPRRFSGRWAQTGSRLCDRGTRFRVPYAEADGLDYLVKPVTEGEVAQAVRKFKALHIKKESSPREDSSVADSKESDTLSLRARRFSVNEGDKIKLIASDDIRLIYAEKRRTFLVTLEGKTIPRISA